MELACVGCIVILIVLAILYYVIGGGLALVGTILGFIGKIFIHSEKEEDVGKQIGCGLFVVVITGLIIYFWNYVSEWLINFWNNLTEWFSGAIVGIGNGWNSFGEWFSKNGILTIGIIVGLVLLSFIIKYLKEKWDDIVYWFEDKGNRSAVFTILTIIICIWLFGFWNCIITFVALCILGLIINKLNEIAIENAKKAKEKAENIYQKAQEDKYTYYKAYDEEESEDVVEESVPEKVYTDFKQIYAIQNYDLLPIELYFKVHPILKLDDNTIKSNYISILKAFLEAFFENNDSNDDLDDWKDKLLKFYEEKFDYKNSSISEDSIDNLMKTTYFKYRYWFLLDCLFIAGFVNQKVGDQILTVLKTFYKSVIFYRAEEFDYVYNAFYQDNRPDDFLNKYPFMTDVDNRFWNEIKDYFYNLFGKSEKCIRRIQEKKVFDVFNIIWKNRRFLEEKETRIMITGNMSAGKSTLLNSIVGKKVAKTGNEATTAKNHYIYNKAGEDNLNYKYDEHLDLDASTDELLENNEENESINISVATRFRLLQDMNNRRLCFIDTPGVNAAKHKEHKAATDQAIKNEKCDFLIYLRNGEHLGDDSDVGYLQDLKKEYSGNIIFLINKLDEFKEDDNEYIDDMLDRAEEDIKKAQFNDILVYPISAYAAYLAKQKLYGYELSKSEKRKWDLYVEQFKDEYYHYDKYWDNFEDLPDLKYIKNEDIKLVLLHSGILNLENILSSELETLRINSLKFKEERRAKKELDRKVREEERIKALREKAEKDKKEELQKEAERLAREESERIAREEEKNRLLREKVEKEKEEQAKKEAEKEAKKKARIEERNRRRQERESKEKVSVPELKSENNLNNDDEEKLSKLEIKFDNFNIDFEETVNVKPKSKVSLRKKDDKKEK